MKDCKVNICGCKGVEALVYDFWNGFAMPYIKFKDIQFFADEYSNEFVEITFSVGYCFEIIEDAITESISYIEDDQVVVAVRSNLPFEGAEFDGEMFVLYNQFKLN